MFDQRCNCCIPEPPCGPCCQGLTGATGEPGPGGTSVYGGLYNAGTQLLFFTQPDTYVQIRLNTALPTSGVTAGNNTLTVLESGNYEVTYNLLMTSSRAVDVAAAVWANGTPIAAT